jgi:threonylcarbamoyladenosine tRNA methylthiotransferase MtaB
MTRESALEILTFGCRLNAYESEAMRGLATSAGLANAVIVNTCAVTSEAERQARQAIRKARRERPDATIIVTGCAAQIDPGRFSSMPEVDRVLGNAEKLAVASYRSAEPVLVGDIMRVRETAEHLVEGFEGKARAFVQVQQGCDHRCTFCIIPFGRGPSRSTALGPLVTEARALVARGIGEVVLTGVDLTAYGGDLPGRPTLGGLVRRLLALVPELKRLRLSSLDPVEIDPELEALFADEPRLMPHLHLSVQAGDDMILKRMKRRHSRADMSRLVERLRRRRADLAFGADFIAGFPTETDAMFENSLALVGECGLSFLHVFPFSPRPGTPAARMPQVPRLVREARARQLRAAGEAARTRFLDSRLGTQAQVLVERDTLGRSEHYAEVRLDRTFVPGSIVAAEIFGRDGRFLAGRTPGHPSA